jgi:hypothetical protein
MDRNSGVPRDDTLRHLDVALDPSAMQAIFQQSPLGAQGELYIRACEIERIRYKPGRNCLICYRLQIEDPTRQIAGEHRLTGRLYEVGGSYSRFTRAARENLAPPAFGPPLLHLPGWIWCSGPFPTTDG